MSKITFLGTGGGRMVVLNQLRKSGGFLMELNGTNILQDPGPGSLLLLSEHNFKPRKLDAIILSHKHIDHSNDVNVLIEAMAGGGFHLNGYVIAPNDCFYSDPVIFEYVRKFANMREIEKNRKLKLQNVFIEFPIKNKHPVTTFGAIYTFGSKRLGYIPDTECFSELVNAYKSVDYLIINVTRMKKGEKMQHLTINNAEWLINKIRPKTAVITHFGFQVLKASPEHQAKLISKKTGINVISAFDGMKLNLI